MEKFKTKARKIYNQKPTRAYQVKESIENIVSQYQDREGIVYALGYIYEFTQNYINEHNTSPQESKGENDDNPKEGWSSDEGKKDEDDKNQGSVIDREVEKQENNLEKKDVDGLETISKFSLKPSLDHIVLEKIYLEDQLGEVQDMDSVVGDIYVLDQDSNIVGEGYISSGVVILNFDDYIMKKDVRQELVVQAQIYKSQSANQVWKISLDFAQDKKFFDRWTYNGLKARSYSNGKYIQVENLSIVRPMEVSISNPSMVVEKDFEPTSSEGIKFEMYNSSDSRMEIDSFEFKVYGSFFDKAWDSLEFVLKENGSKVFGRSGYDGGDKIKIDYDSSSGGYGALSAGSSMEYVLELEGINRSEGSRDIRLENIVIWDGFGGQIELGDYSNTGLPTNRYRYEY